MVDSMKNKILIDVRTREEYVLGHIKGSINVPHYDLEMWKDFLSGNDIRVYCNTGHRTEIARKKLEQMGIDCTTLDQDEAGSMEWVKQSMVCAANFIEIMPGQEEAFREKALKLCRATEDFDGFLGSKVLRMSGVSSIGSGIQGDTRDLEVEPVRYILLTFWESKDAHERSHAIPLFAEIFGQLPENLAKMPYEEFYDILK